MVKGGRWITPIRKEEVIAVQMTSEVNTRIAKPADDDRTAFDNRRRCQRQRARRRLRLNGAWSASHEPNKFDELAPLLKISA
jgi:hypothetical protein